MLCELMRRCNQQLDIHRGLELMLTYTGKCQSSFNSRSCVQTIALNRTMTVSENKDMPFDESDPMTG
jgi:hypothetical protein